MDSPHDVTGPINLGNPTEYTVHELASRIIELTGSNSTIEHLPLPADDPVQRRSDISLALAALGWKPSIHLTQGLHHTVEYFRRLLEITPAR
jgi:UDP-glucuronate decarboxylase